jgi:hypothetical protein
VKQRVPAVRAQLVTRIPDPPPITREVRDELERDALRWRSEMSARVRAVEALTGTDWSTWIR